MMVQKQYFHLISLNLCQRKAALRNGFQELVCLLIQSIPSHSLREFQVHRRTLLATLLLCRLPLAVSLLLLVRCLVAVVSTLYNCNLMVCQVIGRGRSPSSMNFFFWARPRGPERLQWRTSWSAVFSPKSSGAEIAANGEAELLLRATAADNHKKQVRHTFSTWAKARFHTLMNLDGFEQDCIQNS